jgi:hypothetical protein
MAAAAQQLPSCVQQARGPELLVRGSTGRHSLAGQHVPGVRLGQALHNTSLRCTCRHGRFGRLGST